MRFPLIIGYDSLSSHWKRQVGFFKKRLNSLIKSIHTVLLFIVTFPLILSRKMVPNVSQLKSGKKE